MKLYVILLLYPVVCYAQLDFTPLCIGDRLKTVYKQCMEEAGVSKADVTDFIDQKPAQNELAKCFRACVLTECNMMDENGNFKRNSAFEMAENFSTGQISEIKIIENVANMCLQNIPHATMGRCQKAEDFFMCTSEMCKTHYCFIYLQ
ncbi:general odorant-binding protein 28a-like [Musca domestica]|uniref:General odorant-binding protein 28a-like n=1 Tax=Musca domestica TaxID=7370 RepID=A0ABM3UYC1_MUSDO|nr:general odorant-binding protein 28a-like [Musca domestica]